MIQREKIREVGVKLTKIITAVFTIETTILSPYIEFYVNIIIKNNSYLIMNVTSYKNR